MQRLQRHAVLSPVHTSNNAEATFDFVEATFNFVDKNGNSVQCWMSLS